MQWTTAVTNVTRSELAHGIAFSFYANFRPSFPFFLTPFSFLVISFFPIRKACCAIHRVSTTRYARGTRSTNGRSIYSQQKPKVILSFVALFHLSYLFIYFCLFLSLFLLSFFVLLFFLFFSSIFLFFNFFLCFVRRLFLLSYSSFSSKSTPRIILGISTQHTAGDAHSIFSFFSSWSKFVDDPSEK